ncbi:MULTISPECIES: LiaF domain-containing protein [Gammaproteobacteria]|uniref:LiaF domain-containing protein n=1 Tax=Gammaproteobacteria TaxID=1236 RepID=UPI000DD00868|nr:MULTISPECIES: LiaF domain-containing protein [Gammaproteobacteria]RTE86912.1 DUF1707 and DUF2154 domain-containing protein [Aliidiomarina sp. B3213]TCZ93298.1 DUF1707 and DUF2154 domain-containing protein [Lysobacter sp. N42]
MTVKLEDRPIEKVREETIDKLIVNYSHGVISAEAFERRLDQASESNDHQEIVALVEDLPMEADSNYDTYKEKQFTPHYRSGNDDTHQKITTILSNTEKSGQWVVPKRISIVGVLGSTKLDFSDAIFQSQNVIIDVKDALCSIEILVPENVNVVTSVTNILSNTEHHAPNMANRQAPVITIEGWSVLGSIEVKLKTTMKEKFMAFANSIKESFSGKDLY